MEERRFPSSSVVCVSAGTSDRDRCRHFASRCRFFCRRVVFENHNYVTMLYLSYPYDMTTVENECYITTPGVPDRFPTSNPFQKNYSLHEPPDIFIYDIHHSFMPCTIYIFNCRNINKISETQIVVTQKFHFK